MNKLKKIFLAAAISMLGVSVTNSALADEASYKEMIKLNGAQNGSEIVEHPRLKPDNKNYFFTLKVDGQKKPTSVGPVFLAFANSKPVYLQFVYPKYFEIDKSKLKQEYFTDLYNFVMDNMVFNKEYQVVGTYAGNIPLLDSPVPLIYVLYMDTANGSFNRVINVRDPEPKQEEAQSPAASEQDYCKQSFEEGNMVGMTECTEEELSKEDKRLNAEYKAVMSKLDPAQKKELRTKQRAWIKARDQKCKLEEDSGQAGMLNHVSCLNEWTKKRADELAAMR